MQDIAKLTEREIQVLRLKADGETYKAIGHALGIKASTAQKYAIHAREALSVDTVFEAIVKATKLGMFEVSPPL